MQTQDERIMAALSHITILVPLMGIIGPIIIWVTQREKSAFVAFQALQALAYQLLMVVLWFLGMGCYMISIFATFGIGMMMSGDTVDPNAIGMLGFFLPFIVFGVMLLLSAAYVIYGIVGAVQVLRGRDFHYVLIGKWVTHYMEQQTASEIPETQ